MIDLTQLCTHLEEDIQTKRRYITKLERETHQCAMRHEDEIRAIISTHSEKAQQLSSK